MGGLKRGGGKVGSACLHSLMYSAIITTSPVLPIFQKLAWALLVPSGIKLSDERHSVTMNFSGHLNSCWFHS